VVEKGCKKLIICNEYQKWARIDVKEIKRIHTPAFPDPSCSAPNTPKGLERQTNIKYLTYFKNKLPG
jgi:hypothetical protein